MDNASKGLLMGAGILITIVVITFGMVFLNASKGMVSTANEEISDFQQELSQTKYSAFDNSTVTGAQVVSAVRKFAQDGETTFGVYIKESSDTTGTYYGCQFDLTTGKLGNDAAGTIANLMDETHEEYINPSGKFKSIILQDSDGVVRGINFEQK